MRHVDGGLKRGVAGRCGTAVGVRGDVVCGGSGGSYYNIEKQY